MAHNVVISLEQKLAQLLINYQFRNFLPDSELESIYQGLSYCQSFLQAIISLQRDDTVNDLQTQFKDLAHGFEDLMESYVSDWNGSVSESFGDVGLTFRFFQEIVQTFLETINSSQSKGDALHTQIKDLAHEFEEIMESYISNWNRSESVSWRYAYGGTKGKVRLDGQLTELLDWLTRQSPKLHSLSIFGMAGIGKTHVVNKVYNNPIVSHHFELRLFLSVGPQYQLKQLLVHTLGQLGFQKNEMDGKMDRELGKKLYRRLLGSRYLIVLDDIWNTQVWDELTRFFPEDENGSRVIMTTRLQKIAGRASTCTRVPFLNENESWNLLRKMVCTNDEEPCDPQLEKIGRKIAKNCEGLPMAIIEVGRLLCKTERKVESWKEIAEREDPLVITIDDGTPISNTLSLSYKMLPQHLKSCFLYMGVFPKNYEIPTTKLIRLWVSEGLIKQRLSKQLEKVAEGCLNDLFSSSLVLLCKESSRGRGRDRIKTSRIHFVFRNICISAAQNENLFHIIKKYPKSFPQGTNRQRGLCFHNNTVLGFKQVHRLMESVSTARSLLCFGPQHRHPLRLYLHFPSLRILDALAIRFYRFPHQVVELVELRNLAITYDGEIPASISTLCHLEVLIIHRHHQSLKSSEAPVYLPMEIWELRNLKHLQCMGFDLPDPTKEYGFDCSVILENVSTLSGVSAHSCYRGVLERIPNLMKLGIQVESSQDAAETFKILGDFSYLRCLESFKCVVVNPGLSSLVVSYISNFPSNIRKIALSGCGFSWPSMRDLWNLQKLEVLKLKRYAFCGPEWNTKEWRRLTGLKFLLLEDLDIQHWIINPGGYFFNLTHLIIRHCYKLREIPLDVGYIPTLEMIDVDDCSQSFVVSAQRIQEEQQKNGNKSFELRIHSSWDDKKLKL